MLNQLLSAFPFILEGQEISLLTPELKNKHRAHSFFSAKESIFRVKNLRKRLFAALIRQIVTLFAGLIRVIEKGEAPMNENFRFFTLKIDSLTEKNDCTRCLSLSSGGKRLIS